MRLIVKARLMLSSRSFADACLASGLILAIYGLRR